MPQVAQAIASMQPVQPSAAGQTAVPTQTNGAVACKPVYKPTRTETIAGGAAAGGLVAALLAQATGASRVATRNAALAGAIFGGISGANYADQINATEQADGSIKLDIPSKVLFAFGSDKVSPDFEAALQQIALKMMEFCGVSARVVGHTDNVGVVAYNEALSLRRAASVQAVLRARGMQRTIVVEGAGPHSPVANNATAEGRSANRRVELFLVPPPRS